MSTGVARRVRVRLGVSLGTGLGGPSGMWYVAGLRAGADWHGKSMGLVWWGSAWEGTSIGMAGHGRGRNVAWVGLMRRMVRSGPSR